MSHDISVVSVKENSSKQNKDKTGEGIHSKSRNIPSVVTVRGRCHENDESVSSDSMKIAVETWNKTVNRTNVTSLREKRRRKDICHSPRRISSKRLSRHSWNEWHAGVTKLGSVKRFFSKWLNCRSCSWEAVISRYASHVTALQKEIVKFCRMTYALRFLRFLHLCHFWVILEWQGLLRRRRREYDFHVMTDGWCHCKVMMSLLERESRETKQKGNLLVKKNEEYMISCAQFHSLSLAVLT